MGGNPKTLTIPDARGNGASFRVTRHQAERKIVLSQWRDGVCVASTPIELSEVPALIGIFADALGEASVEAPARTPEVWSAKRGLNRDRGERATGRPCTPSSLRQSSVRAWASLQGRMRPAWAEITHLRPTPGASGRGERGAYRSSERKTIPVRGFGLK